MSEEAAPAPNPGRCIYGFALLVVSISAFVMYMGWALTPSQWLSSLGLTYFSSKYWVLAVPVSCCTGIFVFGFLLYPAINLILTPSIDSMSTLVDIHSRSCLSSAKDQEPLTSGILPISDLQIEEVNALLYLDPNTPETNNAGH
jgi:phosphatidylinositol glycan class P protein